jgi:hypothetical protein
MSLTVKGLEKLQSQIDGDYRLELVDGNGKVYAFKSTTRSVNYFYIKINNSTTDGTTNRQTKCPDH